MLEDDLDSISKGAFECRTPCMTRNYNSNSHSVFFSVVLRAGSLTKIIILVLNGNASLDSF